MGSPASLAKFRIPLTAQEIEFLQLDYGDGSAQPRAGDRVIPISQLRLRIRERTRFTTLDLDPVTAVRLGDFLGAWGRAQQREFAGAFEQAGAERCETGAACDG